MRYEITIEHAFTASHALKLPDGSMEPVHEHTWPVQVTVTSEALDGMACVMDFHELQERVVAAVGPWDGEHLNDVEPFARGKVNPSAERVAEHIAAAVGAGLPTGVTLASVSVGEAPGCTARFYP